jgi:hypothetical protein
MRDIGPPVLPVAIGVDDNIGSGLATIFDTAAKRIT